MRSGSHTYQGKEKSQQKKPYQRPEGEGFTSGSYKPLTAVTPGARNRSSHPEVTCFRCGKTGHYANACMNQGPRCFNCNQPGHMTVDCRAPKVEPTVNTAMGKRPAARGRVYIMDGEEVGGADGVIREKRRNDGNFLTIPANF
ncbi:replication protein A 70 kDa DNA-binding subunit C-like [Lotus japonicus]|uniref:replication protein A 70 kDa DNA-binding subunit C-like n=1 Tax=Lotus japonicus TaxID=34305 RepID=UPI00258E431A|nr:replication protein A 70 kDa DNA-binding subunit C-like [Lotus japonicus]